VEAGTVVSDTVTLEMIGAVSLSEFSTTVSRLERLLAELGRAEAQGVPITWLIDALEAVEAESALTAYRGVGAPDQQVADVVRAYGEVGNAIQTGEWGRLPRAVAEEARSLVSILNGRITSLRFETPDVEATVSTGPDPLQFSTPLPGAYGAVEGRVQTLTTRGGLRFTLYDTLYDRAVGCYLAEDFDREAMRAAWGSRAIVAGWVTRDPATGRPKTIRRVSQVVVLPEIGPDDYRHAMGAVPVGPEVEPPEATIRRLRDAE
jgi:hypothetical protein